MPLTYDLKLSGEIASRTARPWGKPYAGGTVKALFVPSVHFGREIVELLQRMDADHENVTIDRIWSLNKWGFGDFYHKREPEILYQNLEKMLTSEHQFDVMVIPGLNGWNRFTAGTLDAIRDRVRSGTGLVLMMPFAGAAPGAVPAAGGAGGAPAAEAAMPVNPTLEQISPLVPLFGGGDFDTEDRNPELDKLRSEPWAPREHYITRGVPFGILPYDELAFFPYRSRGEPIIVSESGFPVGAVWEVGRGRVAAFGWYCRDVLPQHKDYLGWDACYESIEENWHGARTGRTFAWLEYFYSLVNRSIVWAARRESPVVLGAAAVTADRVRFPLPPGKGCTLSYTIRDERDSVISASQSDTGDVLLPPRMALGGEFRIDCRLAEGGRIHDWATLPLTVPRRTSIRSIRVDRAVAGPEDAVTATVDLAGDANMTGGSSLALVFEVVDDYQRVLARERRQGGSTRDRTFTWQAVPLQSLHVRIRAVLERGGTPIQQADTPPVILTPGQRTLEDFEVLICPQNRGFGDLSSLEDALLRKAGCTLSCLGDTRTFARSGAEKLGITWRGPEAEAYRKQKEDYLRTKDRRFLHRQNCMNGPDFISLNTESVPRTVSANAHFAPVTWFANDEGSLTCYTDELDLCFCPDCMREMRAWLQAEYGSLESLNRTWESDFRRWEDVEPLTYLEASRTGRHAPWADHRRFMELTFAGAYRRIRDLIRSVDPEGVVSMSGTQATNAYSGYDYHLLHQVVGRFEAYRTGNQYELHRSFARPGTIIGGWFGYGVSGPTVQSGIWYALHHGLSLISVFWEYACINPDFTFSRSGADMAQVFHEIRREGIGKLLLFAAKRSNLGIAVHYSLHAVHAAYLRQDLARYEGNRDGWLRLLEDLGYQYDMVASQQIEAGELRRKGFRVLVLPYALALSDAEARAIGEFVEGGGRVVADFQTGLMDHHCRARDKGSLDDLLGIERLATDMQPFYVDDELTLTGRVDFLKDVIYGSPDFRFAEYGTRAGAGTAAYVQDFTRTVAAVVVNRRGAGETVYLNFALDGYLDHRTHATGGADMRGVMRRLFDHLGIRRPAVLKTADGRETGPGYETVYYGDGKASYVAVMRELSGSVRLGHDGVALDTLSQRPDPADELLLELPSDAHVYDVRGRRSLGFGRRFPVPVRPGDTVLLSVLPCNLRSLAVTAQSPVICGKELTLRVHIVTEDPEKDYANVLALSFRDPAGEYRWIYSGNHVVREADASFSWQIPFNETPGEWTVEVKDVATGIASSARFRIEQ